METCPWSCILATRGPSTGTDPLHTPHRRTSVKPQPPDPGAHRVPCWLRTRVLRGLDEICGEVVGLTRKLCPAPPPPPHPGQLPEARWLLRPQSALRGERGCPCCCDASARTGWLASTRTYQLTGLTARRLQSCLPPEGSEGSPESAFEPSHSMTCGPFLCLQNQPRASPCRTESLTLPSPFLLHL